MMTMITCKIASCSLFPLFLNLAVANFPAHYKFGKPWLPITNLVAHFKIWMHIANFSARYEICELCCTQQVRLYGVIKLC